MNAPNVSLRNGLWFYFNEVAPRIVVFASAMTGREVVLIDEEIVSEQRNLFSHTGTHRFDHQGSTWLITVALTNRWNREITCTVCKDGTQVAQSARAYRDSKASSWLPFCVGVVSGVLVWIVLDKLGLLR